MLRVLRLPPPQAYRTLQEHHTEEAGQARERPVRPAAQGSPVFVPGSALMTAADVAGGAQVRRGLVAGRAVVCSVPVAEASSDRALTR